MILWHCAAMKGLRAVIYLNVGIVCNYAIFFFLGLTLTIDRALGVPSFSLVFLEWSHVHSCTCCSPPMRGSCVGCLSCHHARLRWVGFFPSSPLSPQHSGLACGEPRSPALCALWCHLAQWHCDILRFLQPFCYWAGRPVITFRPLVPSWVW